MGSGLPPLVDPRLGKAISHVLRQHILVAATHDEISAKGLSEAFDEDLGHVAYHMRVLRDDCGGLLRETRSQPVRGTMQHFYRADSKILLSAEAWRRIDDGIRAMVGGVTAGDLLNDIAEARAEQG